MYVQQPKGYNAKSLFMDLGNSVAPYNLRPSLRPVFPHIKLAGSLPVY